MTKQDIIELNKKLGFETIFFNKEKSILGYTENKTIYLNEFYEDKLETINKHEILHHYENSKNFKLVKENIFKVMSQEEYKDLLNKYTLKYWGVYTNKEIEKGILDTEIVIDAIIGNGNFSKEVSSLVEGMFELIIGDKQTVLEKRKYLNLNLSNKIEQNFAQATIWEKLFVENYYNGKDRQIPHDRKTKYTKVREDIVKALEEIYAFAESKNNFKLEYKNNPYLEREYESEIKVFIARGLKHLADYYVNNKNEALREMATKIQQTLYTEFKHIVDYIKSTEYEPAFKYLMLNETLTKIYRQEKINNETKNIVETRELNKSIKGHLTLNETTLSIIYNNLKEHSNFANLYFAGVSIFNKKTTKTSEIQIENVNTFGKGKWIKFEGKKSNKKEYIKNAQNLSALVQDTPWCTKQLASQHLSEGDFFVFVDKDDKPHIAVKMNGNEIDEVRGLKGGNAQELEDDYREVALEFLTKNKEIKYGKEWLEKEEWNKRLVLWNTKITEDTLDIDDVEQLFNDLAHKDYRSHGYNSNKEDLMKELRKLDKNSKSFNNIFEYSHKKWGVKSKKAIYIGDFEKTNKDISNMELVIGSCIVENELNLENLKAVVGDFDLRVSSNIKELPNLYKIYGDAEFFNSLIKFLPNLKVVNGNLGMISTGIEDLSNLERIGGNADFSTTPIKTMPNLKEIGGKASFTYAKIENLDNLEYIGGNAFFLNSQIKSMKKLKEIGQEALFSYSKIQNLDALEKIGTDADFKRTEIQEMRQLKYMGGDVDFSNSRIKNLENLEYIGGCANFKESLIYFLRNLRHIGGDANFEKTSIKNLPQLKIIEGDARFDLSSIESLEKLESIGKNANFSMTSIMNLDSLAYIGKNANFFLTPITDLRNLTYIKGNANFSSSCIKYLNRLGYIDGVAIFKDCKIENLENLICIKGCANFEGTTIKKFNDLCDFLGGIKGLKIADIENE